MGKENQGRPVRLLTWSHCVGNLQIPWPILLGSKPRRLQLNLFFI
jgi:hypothetical protein